MAGPDGVDDDRGGDDYDTGKLGYDGLNGTRKMGPSYAKSVVYI